MNEFIKHEPKPMTPRRYRKIFGEYPWDTLAAIRENRDGLMDRLRELNAAEIAKGGDTDVFPALPLLQGEPGPR